MNTHDMTKVSLFTAAAAICAQISVPVGAIPFTLHTLALFLSSAVLGLKNGVLSVFMYILLGCVGLPVFSGFKSGVGVLFGATGGYIWGFLISAAVIGYTVERFEKSVKHKYALLALTVAAMFAGLIICYLCGCLQYALLYTKDGGGLKTAFVTCVLPFVPTDTVKILIAALLSVKIKQYGKLP